MYLKRNFTSWVLVIGFSFTSTESRAWAAPPGWKQERNPVWNSNMEKEVKSIKFLTLNYVLFLYHTCHGDVSGIWRSLKSLKPKRGPLFSELPLKACWHLFLLCKLKYVRLSGVTCVVLKSIFENLCCLGPHR